MTIKILNPSGRAVSKTAVRTALVYYCIHNSIYRDCTQCTPVLEYKVLLPCWVWQRTRGIGSLHRAPHEHWPWEKSGRGQRSILVGGFPLHCGYRLCGGCEAAAGPGRAKTSPWGRKTWFSCWFSAAPAAMVEIPEGLRTRPAWWQLDRLDGWQLAWPSRLGLAVCRGVVGCQAWQPWPCMPWGGSWQYLLPQPDLESEGMGSPAEDGVGAVIERIERGTMQLLWTQTRQALRILARSSLVSWRLKLCLGKEKAGALKDKKKN